MDFFCAKKSAKTIRDYVHCALDFFSFVLVYWWWFKTLGMQKKWLLTNTVLQLQN